MLWACTYRTRMATITSSMSEPMNIHDERSRLKFNKMIDWNLIVQWMSKPEWAREAQSIQKRLCHIQILEKTDCIVELIVNFSPPSLTETCFQMIEYLKTLLHISKMSVYKMFLTTQSLEFFKWPLFMKPKIHGGFKQQKWRSVNKRKLRANATEPTQFALYQLRSWWCLL